MRTAAILSLAVALAAGGCTTMREARDRIVRAPPRCQDETVPVYFQPGAAEPSAEGRRAIREAAARARSCEVKAVAVVGFADASGDPASNLELSKRRASAVSAIIMAAGVQPGELQVEALGQTGAVTPQGAADPLRRRAEVSFRLAPKKP